MIDLTKKLAWSAWPHDLALQAFLEDLQPNILRSHGRDHTRLTFVRFEAATPAERRADLEALGRRATSALEQLVQTERYRSTGVPGDPVVSVSLSAAGYAALPLKGPKDARFRSGFQAASAALFGVPPADWRPAFDAARESHAVLCVADVAEAGALTRTRDILAAASPHLVVVGEEVSATYRDARRQVREHFGFVDGRSQALLLDEDVAAETAAAGSTRWSPGFPLSQALLPCPDGTSAQPCGSYLAYCKLEQDVAGFWSDVRLAAAQAKLPPELAGAMVVGRFPDGTPVVASQSSLAPHPVPNDFDYAADAMGSRCPFHAHIRKMNPRGITFPVPPPIGQRDERNAQVLRRGVTYGSRAFDAATGAFADAPKNGVGLLFLAYQARLADQFETLLGGWALNQNFPAIANGLDPLLGGTSKGQTWPDAWGSSTRKSVTLARHVRLLGGGYFFTPSRSAIGA